MRVNKYPLGFLLASLAPIDETEQAALMAVDGNDEDTVRGLIRARIVPDYEMDAPEGRAIIKSTLQYFLAITDHRNRSSLSPKEADAILWEIYGMTMPSLAPPDSIRQFFVWLWEELFGQEAYSVDSLDGYVVNNEFLF